MKIVSGGQTGVDRAALDVALELGISAGGWCPEGRLAEDGLIDRKYPLRELSKGGYRERTIKNVNDSDATIIFCFGEPTGGTRQTLQSCIMANKPYVLINALELSTTQAATRIHHFIANNQAAMLNIAGPRASEAVDAYSFTKRVLLHAFQESSVIT